MCLVIGVADWMFVLVAGNELGAEGGAAIGRALGECKGLTSLDMSSKDEGG